MREMIRLRCPRCKYEWDFKGKAKRAGCPNCGKFFSYQKQYKPVQTSTNQQPILLKCRGCGHKWKYKGTKERARCPKCRRWNKIKIGEKSSINKNILNGSILKAMDQMGIDPLKKTALGDCILLVLDDDALILALNRASRKMKKKPVVLIRKAVAIFLKQGDFL